MLPLGFRFDLDAVIVAGVAHRADCGLLPTWLSAPTIAVAAGGAYRSEGCPWVCPVCRPTFETLLSYELARPTADVVP